MSAPTITRWSVEHWVNCDEYIITTTIEAGSVEQDGAQAVVADGVRIEFEERIEAIYKDAQKIDRPEIDRS